MPHFFIKSNQIENNEIKLSKDENFIHIKKSLRTQIGEKLLFIDENYIQYETEVKNTDKNSLTAAVIKKYRSERFIKHNIYLAQAVLKNEAQNYVIQKAAELGIKGIYPLITDNCVIKPQMAKQKIQHWQNISYEASKQCERPDVAQINNINNFDFLINNKDFDCILFFVERNSNTNLKELSKMKKISKDMKILLVTGPEGGFSKREFDLMERYNFAKLTIGKLILRADTAVIAAIANTIFEFELE